MREKRTLNINLDELCSAMEDSLYEHNYYLDLKTGEILLISDYMNDEETERLRDNIDENPDRYEPIPKAEPREGYEDIEDFIATVKDEHLAKLVAPQNLTHIRILLVKPHLKVYLTRPDDNSLLAASASRNNVPL
jgi:hypothetical protein